MQFPNQAHAAREIYELTSKYCADRNLCPSTSNYSDMVSRVIRARGISGWKLGFPTNSDELFFGPIPQDQVYCLGSSFEVIVTTEPVLLECELVALPGIAGRCRSLSEFEFRWGFEVPNLVAAEDSPDRMPSEILRSMLYPLSGVIMDREYSPRGAGRGVMMRIKPPSSDPLIINVHGDLLGGASWTQLTDLGFWEVYESQLAQPIFTGAQASYLLDQPGVYEVALLPPQEQEDESKH